MKKLFIGSDHAGENLLQILEDFAKQNGFSCNSFYPQAENCDYPKMASLVCQALKEHMQENDKIAFGLLVCGSGIGISMAANRFSYIRAALCTDPIMARLSRQHNDANVLCLGERLISPFVATEIFKVFVSTEFEGGRHKERIKMLEDLNV